MKTALLIQALLWALAGEEPPACPARDAVTQALAPVLIPARQAPASGELPPGVSVVDMGDMFEVTAGAQVQRYNDPARDCAERARVAAVFIALALNPPMLPLQPPVAPPPAPPPVVVKPPSGPSPRMLAAAGVAARLDVAAGGGSGTTHGVAVGGEALFRVERRSLGLLATAGALLSTDSTVNGVRVREQRFPLSLSATLRLQPRPRLLIAGSAGVSLTPFTLEGEGLAGTTPVTLVDIGPRLGLELRLVGQTAVAIASVHAEYFPRTVPISVKELGVIGNTAPWQIGFSLGVEIPVRGQD